MLDLQDETPRPRVGAARDRLSFGPVGPEACRGEQDSGSTPIVKAFSTRANQRLRKNFVRGTSFRSASKLCHAFKLPRIQEKSNRVYWISISMIFLLFFIGNACKSLDGNLKENEIINDQDIGCMIKEVFNHIRSNTTYLNIEDDLARIASAGNEAIPYLLEYLKSDNERVVGCAIWVIGEIGDAGSVQYILNVKKDSRYIMREKISAFTKIGSVLAITYLRGALEDEYLGDDAGDAGLTAFRRE